MTNIYVLIAIIVLLVIFVLLLCKRRVKPKARLSYLASIAFAFVLAGIIFGENRWLGYALMGIGVLLAVVDLFKSLKKK